MLKLYIVWDPAKKQCIYIYIYVKRNSSLCHKNTRRKRYISQIKQRNMFSQSTPWPQVQRWHTPAPATSRTPWSPAPFGARRYDLSRLALDTFEADTECQRTKKKSHFVGAINDFCFTTYPKHTSNKRSWMISEGQTRYQVTPVTLVTQNYRPDPVTISIPNLDAILFTSCKILGNDLKDRIPYSPVISVVILNRDRFCIWEHGQAI